MEYFFSRYGRKEMNIAIEADLGFDSAQVMNISRFLFYDQVIHSVIVMKEKCNRTTAY